MGGGGVVGVCGGGGIASCVLACFGRAPAPPPSRPVHPFVPCTRSLHTRSTPLHPHQALSRAHIESVSTLPPPPPTHSTLPGPVARPHRECVPGLHARWREQLRGPRLPQGGCAQCVGTRVCVGGGLWCAGKAHTLIPLACSARPPLAPPPLYTNPPNTHPSLVPAGAQGHGRPVCAAAHPRRHHLPQRRLHRAREGVRAWVCVWGGSVCLGVCTPTPATTTTLRPRRCENLFHV